MNVYLEFLEYTQSENVYMKDCAGVVQRKKRLHS